MRKSVNITLMHNANFDDGETRHWCCPKNMSDMSERHLTGEKTYKDHVNLPVAIKKKTELIFKDLS